MKKNKKAGIILLVLLALMIVGGIANGTFEDLGNKNIGYYIGFFGAMGGMLVIGLMNLFGKEE